MDKILNIGFNIILVALVMLVIVSVAAYAYIIVDGVLNLIG